MVTITKLTLTVHLTRRNDDIVIRQPTRRPSAVLIRFYRTTRFDNRTYFPIAMCPALMVSGIVAASSDRDQLSLPVVS